MRRSSPAGALAALALALLGCQSGFDEEKETVRPLKVAHARGETKVPGEAERPLTLTQETLDDVLALGLRPVAAALPGARAPRYLARQARGIELLDEREAREPATLEAIDPDLIVGSKEAQSERVYQQLAEVAPTVLSEGGGRAWKLSVRLHGEAIGRTNRAERLLTGWDRRAAAAAAASSGAALSVVRVLPGELRLAGAESFAGTVLADAGAGDPAPGVAFTRLPLRRARSLRGDTLLLSATPAATGSLRKLTAGGAFARATLVEDGLWWGSGGILAARAALADVERALGN